MKLSKADVRGRAWSWEFSKMGNLQLALMLVLYLVLRAVSVSEAHALIRLVASVACLWILVLAAVELVAAVRNEFK